MSSPSIPLSSLPTVRESESTLARALSAAGRIAFAAPFAVFGAMHLAMPGGMAGMVPAWVPGPPAFWVVFTGIALLAASISIASNRLVAWSGPLLAALMATFVFTVHLPALLGGEQMAMPGLLKDMALGGAALLVAARR